MKTPVIVFTFTFLTVFSVIAQEDNLFSENTLSNEEVVKMRSMELPTYRGGIEAMHTFVQEEIKYPELAFNQGVEGVVMVNFRISKEGKILNPYISKSIHPALDQEALRLVNHMPNWTPALQNGEPQEVAYQLPIRFALTN